MCQVSPAVFAGMLLLCQMQFANIKSPKYSKCKYKITSNKETAAYLGRRKDDKQCYLIVENLRLLLFSGLRMRMRGFSKPLPPHPPSDGSVKDTYAGVDGP